MVANGVYLFSQYFVINHLFLQGAAADSEAKSEELSRAVEELHKLLKEAGEGMRRRFSYV